MVIYRSRRKKKTMTVASPRNQYASYLFFNRHDRAGREMCRNIECFELVRSPFAHYCSWKCKKSFEKYHKMNFTWKGVRFKVFQRDHFKCVKCNSGSRLECDHLRPIALMKEFGYTKMNLKTYKEYVYNMDNLRTLCYYCHKDVTKHFMNNIELYRSKINAMKVKLF